MNLTIDPILPFLNAVVLIFARLPAPFIYFVSLTAIVIVVCFLVRLVIAL